MLPSILLNCFLTDKQRNKYFRGVFPPADPFEALKYTLASYAAISSPKVRIFIELDEPYAPRREELNRFIEEEFKDHPDLFFTTELRNLTQGAWQQTIDELIGDDVTRPIWFCCNHDIVFYDWDTTYLEDICDKMALLTANGITVSTFGAHLHEMLGHHAKMRARRFGNVTALQGSTNIDSIQLTSSLWLRDVFFNHDYGDRIIQRTDNWGNDCVASPYLQLCPLRPLFYHYDASTHVGSPISQAPVLRVPPGFFEGQMICQIGGEEKEDEDTVWIDPFHPYACEVEGGVEIKGLPGDVPLFWNKRILEWVDKESVGDIRAKNAYEAWAKRRDERLAARNQAYIDLLTAPSNSAHPIPADWLEFVQR